MVMVSDPEASQARPDQTHWAQPPFFRCIAALHKNLPGFFGARKDGMPSAAIRGASSPNDVKEMTWGENRWRSSRSSTLNSIISAPPVLRPVITWIIKCLLTSWYPANSKSSYASYVSPLPIPKRPPQNDEKHWQNLRPESHSRTQILVRHETICNGPHDNQRTQHHIQ